MGAFFGVGGGFIAGPLMFWLGVPMNFVVGTDLAHMTGKSIVAAKRHRTLGHVDIKLGLIMIFGTIAGVESGARVIEMLEAKGTVDTVIGFAYVAVLLIISCFTAWESLRALKMIRTEHLGVKEALGFEGVTKHIQTPAHDRFARFGHWFDFNLTYSRRWFHRRLAGWCSGCGRMLCAHAHVDMYVLGIATHVAIGTDLFEIMISAGYGTLTHAIKGNVDVMMALVMHTGVALVAQIGAVLTRLFSGPRIRMLFSVPPLIGILMVLFRFTTGGAAHLGNKK
jgi:uncharacterized membrane protein YfcA